MTREEAIEIIEKKIQIDLRFCSNDDVSQMEEALHMAIAALREQEERRWIPVTEEMPDNFISVLGCMTDAGPFPPVRECYFVGNGFFFPALGACHPVSHWMPLPEPPKEVLNEPL